MEIVCVPIIVTAVYGIVELYKLATKNKGELYLKLIPVIALVLGGFFGVLLFFSIPQLVGAENVWVALIIGACSGLSATGANQIFKQLKSVGLEVKEVETEEKTETEAKKTTKKKAKKKDE